MLELVEAKWYWIDLDQNETCTIAFDLDKNTEGLINVLYRWLAPLLLLLDLYEKVSVISKRKAEASKLLVSYCETHLKDKVNC